MLRQQKTHQLYMIFVMKLKLINLFLVKILSSSKNLKSLRSSKAMKMVNGVYQPISMSKFTLQEIHRQVSRKKESIMHLHLQVKEAVSLISCCRKNLIWKTDQDKVQNWKLKRINLMLISRIWLEMILKLRNTMPKWWPRLSKKLKNNRKVSLLRKRKALKNQHLKIMQ